MRKLTKEQNEKIEELVKLGLIDEFNAALMDKPRTAIALGMANGIITSWVDFGNTFIIVWMNAKSKRYNRFTVCEAIIDRLISLKRLGKVHKEAHEPEPVAKNKVQEKPEEPRKMSKDELKAQYEKMKSSDLSKLLENLNLLKEWYKG